jgi:hypothetical protein
MNEQHHTNAVSMEELMKKEFKAERYDLGGIINSDYIDRNFNFWNCIIIIMAKYYSDKKQKIDDFLEKYKNFSDIELKNIQQEDFELIMDELSKLIHELN